MIISQRGVLAPVQFQELSANLQASLLGPAGTRLAALADLTTAVYETGTFTPGWTGFSVNPTGDMRWISVAGHVFMVVNQVGDMTGTSNAITFQLTGVPAVIRPARSRTVPVQMIDNNSRLWGDCQLGIGGTCDFGLWITNLIANRVQGSPAGFTAAGTKGLPNQFTMAWALT